MLIDAHFHLKNQKDPLSSGELIKLLSNNDFGLTANSSSPEEFYFYKNIKDDYPNLWISFGIHPWNVENLDPSKGLDEFTELYQASDAIGEIGMDSLWTNAPLELQRKVFIRQLSIAEKLNKPIILHTKGQEKEIASVLRDYSMKKSVHWYTSSEYLNQYIEQDCYFTVGPDFETSFAVQSLIDNVAINRLWLKPMALKLWNGQPKRL